MGYKHFNTLLKGAILIGSTLLSFAAHASLEDELIKQMSGQVSELDREMVTYRYERNEHMEVQSASGISDRVEPWADRFYDVKAVTSDLAGPGVYVAVDPVSSRSYGGTETPQMYVLTLKKGIRILNLYGGASLEQQKTIKLIIENMKCEFDSVENDYDLFDLRKSKTQECRQVAINVAKSLKVDAIIYSYSGIEMSGCRSRDVALNIIARNVVDYEQSHFFTNVYSVIGDSEPNYSKDLYFEVANSYAYRFNLSHDEKMPLALQKIEGSDKGKFEIWKRNNIYGCGAPWSFERTISEGGFLIEKFNRLVRHYYVDSEVQELMISLKEIIKSKDAQGQYYIDPLVRGLQRLEFTLSGLQQTEENFQKWISVTTNYSDPQYQTKLFQLLNVPTSLTDKSQLDLFKNLLAKAKTKNLPADAWIQMGIAAGVKNLTIYNQNRLSEYRGGIILSVLDPNKSIEENIALSKKRQVNLLKKCIAEYREKKFEDLQNTDCAVNKY